MSDPVLDTLVAWGERTPEIRALILTSNRARPDGVVDEFSDYDVILAVTDPERFAGDLAWQEEAYGPRLVGWGDEDELFGMPTRFRGVVYRDHVKLDYTIWPDALIESVAAHPTLPEALDHGYRVLLDKEDRTRGWPEPTFTAYVLVPPSEAEYRAQVEEFWWDVSYLPKSVRRGDLFFASSFMLEHDLKFVSLRRMLEWRIAIEHAPSPPDHTAVAWSSIWMRKRFATWPIRTPPWTPMRSGTPSSGWRRSIDGSPPRSPRRSGTSTRRRSTTG